MLYISLKHGAEISVTVLDANHMHSQLVQGVLELRWSQCVCYTTQENNNAMAIYKQLVKKQYKEPVEDKFYGITDTILGGNYSSDKESSEEERPAYSNVTSYSEYVPVPSWDAKVLQSIELVAVYVAA